MTRQTTNKIKLLLTVLFLGYVLLEVASYWRMQRPSGRGHRVTQEHKEAVSLRPHSDGDRPTVLLVGNSLILEAVDMDALRTQMRSQYDVHRLVLESTGYPDWSLILPSLFQQGARPSYVVLTISPAQMSSHVPVFMETTHYLLTPHEVLELSRRDHGGASAYVMHFLEYVSPYWGTRSSAQVAFKDAIPGYRSILFATGTEMLGPQQFDPERMRELAAVCKQYNVKLMYLALPANDPNGDQNAAQIQQAAAANSVPYLRPMADSDFHGDDYTDFIHLSAQGKAKFMPMFVPALLHALGTTDK
ncbi:hypothetical protein [Terriglobus sp. RCC_193]|uniref:hypothetical protein n=1 Tax=Terriglobus sp. RCC_193 TaxID=3239218 RepID=UPI00352311C2